MSYNKGDIFIYDFPSRNTQQLKNSKILKGSHRVVVLHKRETPYKTILVAPITKASSLANRGEIPPNYVTLKKGDYPLALTEDISYINLDQVMPVDEKELAVLECRDKKVTAHLNKFDLYQLDYKLALTYELKKYLQNQLALEINDEFENVICYIDTSIREEIQNLITTLNLNSISAKKILDVINNLINTLKETYTKDIVDGTYK